MKIQNFLVPALLTLVLVSCKKIRGEGPVITETREVTGFNGIDLRISADVYFKQDSVYKVEVHAQQNILNYLETNLSNGKLVIKEKNNVILAHDPIEVVVSGPHLNSLRVSGSGDISIANALSTERLDIDVSGSGSVNISQITAGFADANISGSGHITINGGAISEEKTKISGSGSINLLDVVAAKATTNTTGSGDTKLNVSQQLDVTITGSGSVFYKGTPVIDAHITGSGKVKHM